MFEQAAENPTFAARLEALRQFPLVYTARPVNEPSPMTPSLESGMNPSPEGLEPNIPNQEFAAI